MRAEEHILRNPTTVQAPNIWGSTDIKRAFVTVIAAACGLAIWHLPPSASLGAQGWYFLATLTAAVILWVFETFDDYLIALLLLLSWLMLDVLPPAVALSGFASSEWFFALSALGIAAVITKAGLLRRLALSLLKRIPPNLSGYNLILSAAGFLATPFLPNVKARMAIAAPVTEAIADALGFRPRSNASAALALSTYVGFSQLSFVFLTGMSSNLIGWNLLPDAAREQFGWGVWMLVALPAGLVMWLSLVAAIRWAFPLHESTPENLTEEIFATQLKSLGPLTSAERISILALLLAIAGWLSKPLHGVGEAWIGLGCFLFLAVTGVLDKEEVKTRIDWCFMIFFGVISSTGEAMRHLKMDRWMKDLLTPLFDGVGASAELFLVLVLLLVYCVRLVLHKAPTMLLCMVVLVPWAEALHIHPGVLLITILLAIECWFLPYQTDSYLIAYSTTGGKAFSHRQGRKVMVLKVAASFIALLVSIPYWRMLGLMK